MVDLKLQIPVIGEVEVDQETLAAIDRGICDADNGRTVSLEEVRGMTSPVDFQVRISKTALAEFEEILAYSWAKFPVRCRAVRQFPTQSRRSSQELSLHRKSCVAHTRCAPTRAYANPDLLQSG